MRFGAPVSLSFHLFDNGASSTVFRFETESSELAEHSSENDGSEIHRRALLRRSRSVGIQ